MKKSTKTRLVKRLPPCLKAGNLYLMTSLYCSNPLFSSLNPIKDQIQFCSCLSLSQIVFWSGTCVFAVLGGNWCCWNVKYLLPKASPSRIHAQILLNRAWSHTHTDCPGVTAQDMNTDCLEVLSKWIIIAAGIHKSLHTQTHTLGWHVICHFQGSDY